MKSTTRPKTAASNAKKPAAPATTTNKKPIKAPALPDIDEKDDYIVNLKGQVFLLTIENEMLKKFAQEGGNTTAPSSLQNSTILSSQQQQMNTNNLGSPAKSMIPQTPRQDFVTHSAPMSALPPVIPSSSQSVTGSLNASSLLTETNNGSYPPEINDAFEVMRQKYAQLEAQYQRDLDDKRRAAEALASQCAAQSSYITTLKKEVAQANETLADQKHAAQEIEQRAESDLEMAQRDIMQLHDRITELNGIIEELENNKVKNLLAQVAELKAQTLNAHSERNASEQARARALESYSRQFIATRVLIRNWKASKLEVLTLGASIVKLREEKDQLQKRVDKAEIDAAKARASETAATEVLQLARAHSDELQSKLDTSEITVAQLRAQVKDRDINLAELDGALVDIQRRLDASQNACAKAVQHREHALRDVTRLQALLTEKTEEADTLRAEAVNAQRKESEAKSRAKSLEEELAKWHARANAVEHASSVSEKSVRELTEAVEGLNQRLAEREVEISTLRDELARRPPIDVIRALDVDNLMQRNMQAAVAMHQLLSWQQDQQSTTGNGPTA